MEILFKGLIGAVLLLIYGFIVKAFKTGNEKARTKLSDDDKKMQYLSDKFMSLKNTIDKDWEREIIDIVISPPVHMAGYWTITKYIKSVSPVNTIGESYEIYKKTDEELVLEMNEAKNNITDKVKETLNWTCYKCSEENESSFDSCWKCQTFKKID
jgi:hypothetical protein